MFPKSLKSLGAADALSQVLTRIKSAAKLSAKAGAISSGLQLARPITYAAVPGIAENKHIDGMLTRAKEVGYTTGKYNPLNLLVRFIGLDKPINDAAYALGRKLRPQLKPKLDQAAMYIGDSLSDYLKLFGAALVRNIKHRAKDKNQLSYKDITDAIGQASNIKMQPSNNSLFGTMLNNYIGNMKTSGKLHQLMGKQRRSTALFGAPTSFVDGVLQGSKEDFIWNVASRLWNKD